jgi:hypothetical protein
MSECFKKIDITIFLSLCTLLVYGIVGSFDFINYDDEMYVTKNPYFLGRISSGCLAWVFTTYVAGNWHP